MNMYKCILVCFLHILIGMRDFFSFLNFISGGGGGGGGMAY